MSQPENPYNVPPSSPPPPPPAGPPFPSAQVPPGYPPPGGYGAPPPAAGGYYQKPAYLQEASSKKVMAGVLGILLGGLGIHKFVLGYTTAGVIMLVVYLTCIGTTVMHIIGIVEGIIYLTKSDEEFYQTYIANKKEWF